MIKHQKIEANSTVQLESTEEINSIPNQFKPKIIDFNEMRMLLFTDVKIQESKIIIDAIVRLLKMYQLINDGGNGEYIMVNKIRVQFILNILKLLFEYNIIEIEKFKNRKSGIIYRNIFFELFHCNYNSSKQTYQLAARKIIKASSSITTDLSKSKNEQVRGGLYHNKFDETYFQYFRTMNDILKKEKKLERSKYQITK